MFSSSINWDSWDVGIVLIWFKLQTLQKILFLHCCFLIEKCIHSAYFIHHVLYSQHITKTFSHYSGMQINCFPERIQFMCNLEDYNVKKALLCNFQNCSSSYPAYKVRKRLALIDDNHH